MTVMGATTDARRGAKGPKVAADLEPQVFAQIADRLAARTDDIALFTETGCSFEGWSHWEALAACHDAGWTAEPRPAYARAGVAGSREHADLLVFDPATGRRVLVELAIVQDWTTNKWIANLNGDTDRLKRSPVSGLQLILAASLASPIEVNDTWRAWLGMSDIWTQPTRLRRSVPLGNVGEMLLMGWTISAG